MNEEVKFAIIRGKVETYKERHREEIKQRNKSIKSLKKTTTYLLIALNLYLSYLVITGGGSVKYLWFMLYINVGYKLILKLIRVITNLKLAKTILDEDEYKSYRKFVLLKGGI